ncbi:hypothetical protein C8P66_111102 [Humitalea rosea]|uniref:Uncharacterized protein n=1 Tax=Humitalea rosea TaxID=990373 RepID=A0A2W7IKD4_9PROT|nr:hypothetical protein [Humitalea rosea]PZW45687.1 hypothetical protein C8P66_111102 [Humitalea rosea]
MSRFFKRAACLSFLLALTATPALAQRSGPYRVAGTNLDGSAYEGAAMLQQVGTISFHIIWRVGGTEVRGVGIVSGHSFAVAYGATSQPGMGLYQLRPDGTLEGTWSVIGANGTGTETLTPLAEPAATPGPATPGSAAPAPAAAAPAVPAPRP